MENIINNNCTVVLPTYFPGDEILDNIRSIPEDVKILVIDNSIDDRLVKKINNFSVKQPKLSNPNAPFSNLLNKI